MRDLLNYLLKEITGKDNFQITEEEEEGKVVFTIESSPEEMGLIIGKEGKTIKAIQELLRIVAKKEKKIVFVDIASENK
jgi:predicted RNA-binding protein YlqC (UPF0109 family)